MADEHDLQTSNKAGLRSLGKKLDNSRYGFDEHPGSRKPAGAFGREESRGAGEEESVENAEADTPDSDR
jgi:hypothetical protein